MLVTSDEKLMERLTSRERGALENWQRRKEPPLAPSLNAALYQIFLTGRTCEDIARLKPGLAFGSIVHARLAGRWDEAREQYCQDMVGRVNVDANRAQVEALDVMSQVVTLVNADLREKIEKYLTTGEEKDLPFKIDTVRGYGELLNLHRQLAGLDVTKIQITVPMAGAQPQNPRRVAAQVLSTSSKLKALTGDVGDD